MCISLLILVKRTSNSATNNQGKGESGSLISMFPILLGLNLINQGLELSVVDSIRSFLLID